MKRIETTIMMNEDVFENFVTQYKGKFKCDLSEDYSQRFPHIKDHV